MKKTFVFVATILLLTASAFVYADQPQHIIVIDAGSSGSRLHLFEYENTAPSSIPLIKEIYSKRSNDFVLANTSPDTVGNALAVLLTDAAVVMKDKSINADESVKVYVLGTAGMRLFALDHPQAEKAIYEKIKQFIKDNSFADRHFVLGNAKTIDETMEALYGWLDVNYLTENFQNHRATVGSLDIGGASIEIAFATPYLAEFAADQQQLTIGSETYNIFCKSYLGLGQDEARASLIAKDANLAENCFPTSYSIDTKGLIGHFNSAVCKSLYADFLQSKSLASTLPPVLAKQNFIAFSGADFTYSFLYSGQLDGNVYSQNSLEQKIETICNKSNDEQLQSYCPAGQDKLCPVYCANGVYLDLLFYETLGLRADQLQVKHEINHEGLDWPLGAVLYYLVSSKHN